MAKFYHDNVLYSHEYIEFLEILNVSAGWVDIYDSLTHKYSDDVNKLKQLFQIFNKLYFFCEPSVCNQFRNVWLYSDVPLAIKKQLGFDGQDYDIDLILEDQEGYLSVVQSRFCVDQSASLSWKKNPLHVLPSGERKADFHIIFTNASNFIAENVHLEKENTLKVFSLSELLHISTHTIEKMKRTLLNLTSNSPVRKAPRDYQQIAIDKVVEGFNQADRGQLIMPCGTGKTLISLWIHENLKPNYTLVLFPSLALLRQTKNEWAENQENYVPYMCVCSEKDINKTEDNPHLNLHDISGLVSTDPHVIKTFLKKNTQAIVYSTYQSLQAIADAMRNTDFSFDLALCDEAHKTAGRKNGLYGFIHDDANIRIKKRLYMTATPRILGESTKNRLNEEEISYLADMGNSVQFGYEFHHMSFKDAIDQKILVDYKIIAMGVSDDEVDAVMNERYLMNTDVTKAEVADNYALEKFMSKYQSVHAITFHSSVRKAQGFQERHMNLFQGVDVYHVNGKQSTNDRNALLKKFEESPKSIVTNARCLTEGVDVPVIDAVYFLDPKNSKIDIIQATGRALRRADHLGKEIGYIVVPIFHRNKDLLEEAIEEGAFQNIVNVVRAMSSQDDRLIDYIQKKTNTFQNNVQNTDESIVIDEGLTQWMNFEDLGKLKDSFFDQVISKVRMPWRSFQEARAFAHNLNLKNNKSWKEYCRSGQKPEDIPAYPDSFYKNNEWISWSDWLGSGAAIPITQHNGRSFQAARSFVNTLNLKNIKEWKEYCKSGEKPQDIPTRADAFYKENGWLSWGDWLGTGFITGSKKNYLSLQQAKNFVHALNLSNREEWKEYCKSGKKPENIPFCPYTVYIKCGWISWGDWVGNGRTLCSKNRSRPYHEARLFIHKLNLKKVNDWYKYCKSGEKPNDIPFAPEKTYQNKGWVSWSEWLGTGSRVRCQKNFKTFHEAKKFVHSLNIKDIKEWKEYCKSGEKPNDMPSYPNLSYKNNGWISWLDWLGVGSFSKKSRQYKTFEEAKSFIQTLKLQGIKEWKEYCKSGTKPNDIPATPNRIYKNDGWNGWLGKTKTNQNHLNNSNYGTDEFLAVTEIFDFTDPSFHIIDSNGDSSDERL